MQLANFILSNMEAILQEWEDFAATLVPSGQILDKMTLRDHVKKMLETISIDLDKPESEHDEIEKSKGHANSPE